MKYISVIILIFAFQVSKSVPVPTPTAYWKLDEVSGAAADAIGTNHYTITGATQNQTGKIGKCISFDGTDYGTASDAADLQMAYTSHSISAWVYITGYPGAGAYYCIVSGEQYAADLRINETGHLIYGVYYYGYAGASTGTLPTNEWVHVAVTRNYPSTVNNVVYYINGTASGTVSFSTQPSEGAGSIYLGCNGAIASLFVGKIDEVGLWKIALSSDQISSIYNDNTGCPYPFNCSVNQTIFNRKGLNQNVKRKSASVQPVRSPNPSSNNYNIIYHEEWATAMLDANWTYTEVQNYFGAENLLFLNVNWFNPPINTQSCAAIENDTLDGVIRKSLKVSHPYLPNDNMMYGFDAPVVLPTLYNELYCSYVLYLDKNHCSTHGGKYHGLRGEALNSGPGKCPTGAVGDAGFVARVSFEEGGQVYPYFYLYGPDLGYCPFTNAESGNEDLVDVDTAFLINGNHHLITTRLVMNSFTGATPNADGIFELFVDNYVVQQQTNLIYRLTPDKGITSFHFANWHGGTGISYKPVHTHYTKTAFADSYESPNDPTWGTRNLHNAGEFLHTPYEIQDRYLYYDHLITVAGTYQSSGYSAVAPQLDETWLIDAGPGNTVTVDIIAGGIGGGDRLHIIDGNQTDSKYKEVKEGYMGDISSLGPYTSSGRYLFIRYSADYDGGYIGVRFTVTIN